MRVMQVRKLRSYPGFVTRRLKSNTNPEMFPKLSKLSDTQMVRAELKRTYGKKI